MSTSRCGRAGVRKGIVRRSGQDRRFGFVGGRWRLVFSSVTTQRCLWLKALPGLTAPTVWSWELCIICARTEVSAGLCGTESWASYQRFDLFEGFIFFLLTRRLHTEICVIPLSPVENNLISWTEWVCTSPPPPQPSHLTPLFASDKSNGYKTQLTPQYQLWAAGISHRLLSSSPVTFVPAWCLSFFIKGSEFIDRLLKSVFRWKAAAAESVLQWTTKKQKQTKKYFKKYVKRCQTSFDLKMLKIWNLIFDEVIHSEYCQQTVLHYSERIYFFI